MENWRDYEDKTTIELIELIKMKNNSSHLNDAENAFKAFYFRFFNIIGKKAHIISKRNGYDEDFALEITERTFEKFWKYPAFNVEKMKGSNPDKGVELYLYKIAQRCFYDLMNEKNGINVSPYDGTEEIVYDIPVSEEYLELDNERFQIINKVLSTFSDKHRIIYLTYLQYEQAGHKLPRKLLVELREKLNITQDTVRFYRYEVLSKIEEYTELWKKR